MKHSFYLAIGLAIFSAASCNKDDDKDPVPTSDADLRGAVSLYDESVTQADNFGMTVTLTGSSGTKSAVTDSLGDYSFSNISFGTYDLTFEKTGYGTFKQFGFIHDNSNGPTNIPSLGQSSTTQITNVMTSESGGVITVAVSTSPPASINNTRYIRLFFHTDNAVSNTNYTAFSDGIAVQISPIMHQISSLDLNDLGFTSGITVYVKAYGDSFWSNSYEDPDLSRTVFPNLNMNSSTAVSFVVP